MTDSTRDGDELEVKQRDELQSGEGMREGTYFRPPVDIFETDDELTLTADMPGCDPDEFDINLEDNRLTITAPNRGRNDSWEPVYEEYREGHFYREFQVGRSIDRKNITASFDDGVLTVHLPKSDGAKSRTIEIEEG